MDFPNLNPRDWFRREAPKPVQSPLGPPTSSAPQLPSCPDHLPKYKLGQHCLVIKTNGKIKMGTEVVLIEPLGGAQQINFGPTGMAINPRTLPKEWAWVVDKSYLIPQLNGRFRKLVFPESWLMPLDDATIGEYLKNEALDDREQRMVNFGKALDQFDVMLKAFEEELKSRGAKRI